MKTKFILFALLVIEICSCSNGDSSDNDIESQPNLTLNVTGMPEIILENVSGPVIGSNYEAENTESAQIIATSSSNDIKVTINLVDNDNETQVIQTGSTISIDSTQSTNVFATLTILDNTTIYEAISGSFSVSDGSKSATGTFSDIELMCSECGG